MNIPEETLMAYVDGELDPAARAQVEAAMGNDPQILRRIAEHRELLAKIRSAYAAELAERVPDRLLAAARQSAVAAQSNIVNLGDARAAAKSALRVPPALHWRLPASLAASLLIGVGIGFFTWRHSDSIISQNTQGAMIADGSLAGGLSSQLAGEHSPDARVEIGLSFIAKSGDYCRTFKILSEASSAGLACRHEKKWEIRVLTQPGPAGADSSEYRTASSALAPAILNAVEQQIAGEPLDRAAELAARKQGWEAAAR